MNLIEALESIEAAAQGNARLEALKKADAQCKDLRHILFLTLSPEVTFGIKKLPTETPHDTYSLPTFSSDEEWLKSLLPLLTKLRFRQLTGHAAQEHVASMLGTCATDNQLKWTERILRQDLRLNIGAKDVNNTLGKGVIYLFEVPLATDYKKVKPKDIVGIPWALQPKLDGGRAVAVIPANLAEPVRMLSRTGKEWLNFESVRRELEACRSLLATDEDLYLDGEVVSVVDGVIDFQSIQKTMMRKDGKEIGKLMYIVFDGAKAREWKDPQLKYIDRLSVARDAINKIHSRSSLMETRVMMVTNEISENIDAAGLEALSKVWVEKGYEGLMARQAFTPVVNKRSKTLLKIKNFLDDEAEVIGAAELQREGKGAGLLGALICKLKSGVQFEIGSGFNAKQRTEFWNTELPKTVSFKYFELTDDGVPRFPIFRYFRAEDDIGTTKEEE